MPTRVMVKILKILNHPFKSILQESGGYTTRIRRLYNKDQEVIQHGSGGYTTRIRKFYNKDQEVIGKKNLVLVLLSASVERCFVSRVRDFRNLIPRIPTFWNSAPPPPVMCQISRVICHVLCVTCHVSHFFKTVFDKVVKLVSGGSVINGATLSSFYKVALFVLYWRWYWKSTFAIHIFWGTVIMYNSLPQLITV